MNVENQTEPKPKRAKKQTFLKQVNQETAKLLSQLKEKANKKDFGRKIKESEILSLAIKQVTEADLSTLRLSSYSEKDRLLMAHKSYQAKNGKITLDQFIGKLMRREIESEVIREAT
ncbi:MAG: hypothetical protein U1E10_16195 [Bdellovibrionales bacterium]|nr:hypothetical protein [Bdellovibrionales bacterium]